jgi:hypothetical protein
MPGANTQEVQLVSDRVIVSLNETSSSLLLVDDTEFLSLENLFVCGTVGMAAMHSHRHSLIYSPSLLMPHATQAPPLHISLDSVAANPYLQAARQHEGLRLQPSLPVMLQTLPALLCSGSCSSCKAFSICTALFPPSYVSLELAVHWVI